MIAELSKVNICCEVSMIFSMLILSRYAHLEQLYFKFSYLKKHHNTEMFSDPTKPAKDEKLFEK